jgi:hypothetical protein
VSTGTKCCPRCWYSIPANVGLRSPVCVRCGNPNPRPLSDDQWADLLWYREVRGRPFRAEIEQAIQARIAATANDGGGR